MQISSLLKNISLKYYLHDDLFFRIIFFIQDAILFIKKTAVLMFRTIGIFYGLFRRLRVPKVFEPCVAIDNLELVGLALQLGAFRQAHWFSRNSWRLEAYVPVLSRGTGVTYVADSRN